MKKLAAFLILFFCISGFAKTLIIEGNYKVLSGKSFKKEWKVNIKENKVEFFLDGKLRATMYIENGKVVKIEEIKKFAGKNRLFVITKPRHIKIELKTQFYPFAFVLNYLLNKPVLEEKKSIFKILEVREK